MSEALPRLSAAQAAARLGVKPETLYAYVSRGLLTRERTPQGSSFDPLEVEGFARGRRRPTSSASGAPGAPGALGPAPRTWRQQPGTPLMVLDTDIAMVEDDELYFRGRAAAELVDAPVEAVAAWLWGEASSVDGTPESAAAAPAQAPERMPEREPERMPAPQPPPQATDAARTMAAALPPGAGLLDRIQLSVTALAAADPFRYDTSAENLRRVGGLLLRGIPLVLAPRPVDRPRTIAELLWPALGGEGPSRAGIRALNAALVLTIDHDLAVSTLAARVAASARASGYAVVTAALGAFDAPLHGNASRAGVGLIGRVLAGETPEAALASALLGGGHGVPGFGHRLYSGTDARTRALLPLVAALPAAAPVMAAADALTETVLHRTGLHPNVDFALAALVVAAGLREDAGTAVFALGRLTGWIAHALDEYEQQPMRLRPAGRYVGP